MNKLASCILLVALLFKYLFPFFFSKETCYVNLLWWDNSAFPSFASVYVHIEWWGDQMGDDWIYRHYIHFLLRFYMVTFVLCFFNSRLSCWFRWANKYLLTGGHHKMLSSILQILASRELLKHGTSSVQQVLHQTSKHLNINFKVRFLSSILMSGSTWTL